MRFIPVRHSNSFQRPVAPSGGHPDETSRQNIDEFLEYESMKMRPQLLAFCALSALVASCASTPAPDTIANSSLSGTAFEQRCGALGQPGSAGFAQADTRILEANFRPAGAHRLPAMMGGAEIPLPPHCEVTGIIQERTGIDGQSYAIRFRMRLPENWNGRFLFQGGGGTSGDIGDAMGLQFSTGTTYLGEGFAVLTQDAGHSNELNSDPARGGQVAFGFDPVARANYGGDALAPVAMAGRELISTVYDAEPSFSYFSGCSKGGQEGMVLAQQHPELFDGIVASAPGFSLPRAAVAEVWDTQAFANIIRSRGLPLTPSSLGQSFSDRQLDTVREAVLAACDGDDGAEDGIVGAFRQCSTAKVLPQLRARQCASGSDGACLEASQIDALVRVHEGPKSSEGTAIYASFPWDAGWTGAWRGWKIGSEGGEMPSINVAMGAPALAAIFTSPPTIPGAGMEDYFAYALGFDFDRDTRRLYQVAAPFSRSAWDDISARSSDLSGFVRAGGKLIVPHGVSDPVFSVNDTIAWWEEVDGRLSGRASQNVRVFPVPGMAHCAGGPATDRMDALTALVRWVEHNEAPDSLPAVAGPGTPWPGRERPICRYPLIARPVAGSPGEFSCQR